MQLLYGVSTPTPLLRSDEEMDDQGRHFHLQMHRISVLFRSMGVSQIVAEMCPFQMHTIRPRGRHMFAEPFLWSSSICFIWSFSVLPRFEDMNGVCVRKKEIPFMPFEAYVCVCSATVLARGKGEPGLHTSLSLLDSIIKGGFTSCWPDGVLDTVYKPCLLCLHHELYVSNRTSASSR